MYNSGKATAAFCEFCCIMGRLKIKTQQNPKLIATFLTESALTQNRTRNQMIISISLASILPVSAELKPNIYFTLDPLWSTNNLQNWFFVNCQIFYSLQKPPIYIGFPLLEFWADSVRIEFYMLVWHHIGQ